MRKLRLLALGLVLGFLTPAVFGAPVVVDTDSDGVPDDVERWLARNGAAVSPTVSNVYADSDGDGIPDLVETHLTRTNPAVNDSTVCAGGGTPVDMTGQYDTRISPNLANPVSNLTDTLSAISICHTAGGLTVYSLRLGYADSASITGSGPYTATATWNNGGGPGIPVVINGTCPAPCTALAVTITGTQSVGGVPAPATATRRVKLTAGSAAAVSGAVYGLQFMDDPKPVSPSAFNISHIGTESVQMITISGATARLDHKSTVLPGYYVASVGTYFFAQYFIETYSTGPSTTVTETGYASFPMMFTAIPAAGVGGMIRGDIYEIVDSNVAPTAYNRETLYGKAQVPLTGGVTLNTSAGVTSFLFLNNVPVSADSATVSGPGLTTTTVFNDLDADLTNNKGEYYSPTGGEIAGVVKHRARIPAFTDGEAVGLAGNGSDLNTSNIVYNHSTTLPSNTYAFTFAGALGGFTSVNVAHTDNSTNPLPVVTGVQWDGAPLTALSSVNMAVSHTLTWTPVTTGGIGGNGVGSNSVGLYRVIISAPNGGQLVYSNSGSNSVNRFLSPTAAGCVGGGTCTYTIAANTLGSSEGYVIRIEARDDSDANNRSRTGKFYINAPVDTTVYSAVLPVSRSVQVGQTATAFATILNAGTEIGYNCGIAPVTSIPATFSYQTTNPATNAVTGTPNTPVNISVGGFQTFVFAFTPTAPFSPTDVQLAFDCTNSDPAPIYANAAVNTLLFVADSNPVPDVVAQGATLTGDGIVNIPGASGNTLFAVGSSNVGVTGNITVSADTGSAVLPVVLNVCETNPGTGACISAIAPTITVSYTGVTNRSFAVFVSGTGTVPFDPANSRVIVRFKDGGSVTRGATSVAVRTQ